MSNLQNHSVCQGKPDSLLLGPASAQSCRGVRASHPLNTFTWGGLLWPSLFHPLVLFHMTFNFAWDFSTEFRLAFLKRFIHAFNSLFQVIYNSFIKFKVFKLYLMCLAVVHTCLSVHHIHGDQREHLEEVELRAVVSCQAVLGIEPRTFQRADSALTIVLSPSNFHKTLKKDSHPILGQRRPSVDPSQGWLQLPPATHKLVTNAMTELKTFYIFHNSSEIHKTLKAQYWVALWHSGRTEASVACM